MFYPLTVLKQIEELAKFSPLCNICVYSLFPLLRKPTLIPCQDSVQVQSATGRLSPTSSPGCRAVSELLSSPCILYLRHLARCYAIQYALLDLKDLESMGSFIFVLTVLHSSMKWDTDQLEGRVDVKGSVGG